MRDYISLGSVPIDEPCAQVGEPDYYHNAKAECVRYLKFLQETFGPEPPLTQFRIQSFAHDYGRAYEVVIYYESEDPISRSYAFNVEDNLPEKWNS